jgi:tetratricopeptide (TPR) repeat protein
MQCALTSGRLILIRLLAFVLAALLLLALASGCAPNQRADRAVFDSGYAALQAGRWSQAVTDFSRYLRMDPDSPERGEVYYYRGQALVHLERRPEAKADFLRALGADARSPIDQFAHVALGNLYYEEANDVEAVKQYAAVLDDPHDEVPVPDLLLRTGVALQRLGQWEKGRRYLEYLMVHYSDSAAARQAARYAAADAFRVQTGAFSAKSSAAAQAQQVRQAGFTPRLAQVTSSGRRLTAVQVGRERTYSDAATLAQRLRRAGFNTLIVP